jgi:hypothetical protein
VAVFARKTASPRQAGFRYAGIVDLRKSRGHLCLTVPCREEERK